MKLESFNPTGSIKIRIAKEMLFNALENNIINKSTPIIEPTSGNTGIALAMLCSYLDMKFIAVMPENMSTERQLLIKLYGGEVVLTNKDEGINGSIKKANQLKEELNGCILNQFDNENNYNAHYLSTAIEIEKQTNNEIDYIICGIGTGGTISGIGKYFKDTTIKIIGVRPKTSHDNIQGLSYDITPNTLLKEYIDNIIYIEEHSAVESMKYLIKNEGISVGISTGSLYEAAKIIASKDPNKTILIISPDSIEKYISGLTL